MKNYTILLLAVVLSAANLHAQNSDFEVWAKQKREQYDKWKKMRADIVSHLPNNPQMDAISSFIDQGFEPSRPVQPPPPSPGAGQPITGTGQPATPNHPVAPDNMRIWVVIIGIADYERQDLKLTYTKDDAYKMFAFYKSPEGGALPDAQIALFVDEDATRPNVLKAVNNIYSQASAEDVVIFYFSGHGSESAFITHDYNGNILNNRGLILHDELYSIFDKSKARYKYVIVDACHSGNLGKTDSRKELNVPRGTFYQAFERSKSGFVLLLSSMGNETSIESRGVRQGIFSYYLLKGLKGECDKNRDNIISVIELYDYVRDGVVDFTKGKQNPLIGGKFDETLPVAVVRR